MALIMKIKQIRMKRKITVYGFIRQMEKLLQIPTGIIDLCIIFYGNGGDQWDPTLISAKDVKLDQEKQIVTTLTNSSTNVYMKRIIESGHHEWKLKVKFHDSVYSELMIGLWRIKKNKTPPVSDDYYTNGTQAGYGYHCSSKNLIDPELGCGIIKEYGIKVTDSIIDMIVDFDDLSLSFKIDGIDYGKAFDITQDKYRVAVYFNQSLFSDLKGGDYIQILE